LFAVLSGVPLGVSLIVGLFVSVVQAATQIQEQTLTFVPKLCAVCVTIWFAGSWMVREMMDYCVDILTNLPDQFTEM